jgi:N-methylhydantoinase B/oxoprolinase/acetone carboxylase alpha subunit
MGGGMTQIAAANLGEKRVIELAKRYGIDTLSFKGIYKFELN